MKKKSIISAFSIASVWFGAHVGGGFATGNQTMNFFVKSGWVSIFYPFLIILILGIMYRECLIMAKNHNAFSYKIWSVEMYKPFDKVFSNIFELIYLMIVLLGTGGSIAGSASLLQEWGIPYIGGVLITGIIFYLLTIFGSGLIRKASTFFTIIIIICMTILCIIGISHNFPELTSMINNRYIPENMTVTKGIIQALKYSGFQSVVIAIVLSASDSLKTDEDVNWTIFFGVLTNGIMITLSCIMLLAWMPGNVKETLPILYVCKKLDIPVLYYSYSAILFTAFISTGIGCIFGAVTRFEKIIKKPVNITRRRGIISLLCMIFSMGISLVGLTKIVVIGYGYVGTIGFIFVVIPCIIVGRIKNYKFKKDNLN